MSEEILFAFGILIGIFIGWLIGFGTRNFY